MSSLLVARALRALGPFVAFVLLGTALAPASARPVGETQRQAPASRVATIPGTDVRPFARETVRIGDVDRNPYDIEHVLEVQLRLQRLGLVDFVPNGEFGPRTERAVKRFQQINGLDRTGVVNDATWVKLIRQSVRGKAALPSVCLSKGWHACYNRTQHQVNVYRSGELVNSYLVRGGSADRQTRVGDFEVFRRSEDHVSQLYGAPMPYSQFFSGGQALHGSRAMMNPYVGYSHGCVNFWVEDARQLWRMTSDKRLFVHVYGAWD